MHQLVTPPFIAKRFRKLIIPYIAFTIIAILPKYIFQNYLNETFSLSLDSFVETFLFPRHNVWGHFWFIPMIFILGIVGQVLDRFFIRFNGRVIGWSSLTALSLSVYIYFYDKQLTGWCSVKDIVSYGWVFCSGILCAIFKIHVYIKSALLVQSFIGNCVSIIVFSISIFPPQYKIIIISISMIYSLVCLCTHISNRFVIHKNTLFAHTFQFYILSWPCQAIGNVIAERILNLPFLMIMCVQLLFGILGPTFILIIIKQFEQKHSLKWLNYILGN